MPKLRQPYLIFLGDTSDWVTAKTGLGVRDWAPEASLGQHRLTADTVDIGLPDMTPAEAAAKGAGSLLLGVAPAGGMLPAAWYPVLEAAVDAGLDIVSGLHDTLTAVPGLADRAAAKGVTLYDIRHGQRTFPVGTGIKRPGKRLLTVGTDCALGKKYTALALTKALNAKGIAASFRATGQTGVMISGDGVAIDSVIADFIAGAAEALSPAAAPDHWDIVEGQGSLLHPAYAGVTMGLVHGSQPDALVLCHQPGRTEVFGCPGFKLPSLTVAAARYIEAAQLTNPAVRLVGVSLYVGKLEEAARADALAAAEAELGVPAFDPILTPLDAVVDRIAAV